MGLYINPRGHPDVWDRDQCLPSNDPRPTMYFLVRREALEEMLDPKTNRKMAFEAIFGKDISNDED